MKSAISMSELSVFLVKPSSLQKLAKYAADNNDNQRTG